jgi:hypothetical protein
MYEEHCNIDTPSADTVIWRYMSLEKLQSLLCEESLFFTRIDGFQDRWEGVLPRSLREAEWNMGRDGGEKTAETAKKLKKHYYVNCWHASEWQSAALWGLYARDKGVAIKTTVGNLISSISDSKNFYVGQVEYADYSTHVRRFLNLPFCLMETAFMKRMSFEHEKEVRVIHWDRTDEGRKSPPSSCRFTVSLPKLIEKVVISPTSPEGMKRDITMLMEESDLYNIPVERSDLYDEHIR